MNIIRFSRTPTILLTLLGIVGYWDIPLYSQDLPPFAINGNASQLSANCYRLTPEAPTQAGSIWSESQINLTQSFEAEAHLYLGCTNPISCFEDSDDGADGIVFAFQPISTSVGSNGGGMGILGITPSFFIEFDTYPNGDSNDPLYDHIAISKNGDTNHLSTNSLTAAVPMLDATTNAEDCNEHVLNVRWNADTQTMSVYFDCALKLTYTGDIVNEIFNGDPNVFWGFTAATGGCDNEQRVCISIPPTFQTNDTTICAGESVQLNAPDNGTFYLWTPADGLTNPTLPNPIATPDVTTTYHVAVSNSCDFVSEFSVTINVNPVPSTELDTTICEGEMLFIGANIYIESGTYIATFDLPTGCDSLVTTHLTVLPNSEEIIETSICAGASYILPNFTEVNQSGTYTAILASQNGCDSTITVNLTVNNPNCDDNNCNTEDTLNAADCTCTHTPLPAPDCNDNDIATLDSYNADLCTCIHTPLELKTLVIPSAFSPNGDNINDEFGPIASTPISGLLRIYNRWGQLVFETQDLTVGWNGKHKGSIQELGVYVYLLEYSETANPNEVKLIKGNVTLIR